MVSTVRPNATATPCSPIPRSGKAADRTALPQPPSTSQNVPRNSAPYAFKGPSAENFSGGAFSHDTRRCSRARRGAWSRWLSRVDLSLEKPAKPSPVLLLQLRLHPVLSSDGAPAARAPAPALHGLVVQVVGGGPVDRELLVGADVPHGH